MHRLWRLRAGLPGVRDLRAGRPARKVEGVHGTERKLRQGGQVYARRVRQAPDREAGLKSGLRRGVGANAWPRSARRGRTAALGPLNKCNEDISTIIPIRPAVALL